MEDFFLGILEITAGMSLMIVLMLAILKLIGGRFTAKCRYILWTLVLVRLAVPFGFGILPALIEVPIESEPEPVQIQMQVPTAEYTPVPQSPVTVQPQEQIQMPAPPMETPMFTEPEPEPLTWDDIAAFIPYLYLAGAAAFLLWNLLCYWIYIGKILRSARAADPDTQAVYEAVCRKNKLNRPPVLLVSDVVNSPAAFGIFRRRIVLPDIGFTVNGLAGTLSHEVTHCKRGDLWIKAVCLLARSLHWFNPLVHLAAFRCEMEMELSCDESVLAGCGEDARAAYGEVMLDIIRRCRRNRGALTTHFNPRKNAVKARFTNILYGSGKKRGLWLIAVCLVLCVLAGAIVACRTEGEKNEDPADESESVLWTYTLSDMYTLSYGTDDVGEYYLSVTDEDGSTYPLTKVSLDLFGYGSNDNLYETLPLHSAETDTGYLFCLRYDIRQAYFYEFTLTQEDDRLVFDGIRLLTDDEAKEMGIYSTEMAAVTSLEELAVYLDDGIITQQLYDFYYDLLSGESGIPEYDTLEIEDFTIRFTVPMTEYASYFDFTVKKSDMDTLPPGNYSWQILDIREVTVSGRDADNSAWMDIPEVQKLFAFFDSYYAYNTPFWGESVPHPGIHNYIIEYYGERGSIDREEYMHIAEAEFGITDFTAFRLDEWTDENGRLYSGGVGGGWFGEVTDVYEKESSETVCIDMQFYADCSYLLKSHKITYYFGKDGTWQGYAFRSRSAYEPDCMYFAEYGASDNTAETDNIMTVPAEAVWQNFLDTAVAPYEEFIRAKEFLDLDGNGVAELLLYDKAMGICEIYTIEGGEVKAMYNGTSLLTVYSDTPDVLAPPSLGATDEVFYASPKPDSVTDKSCKNWFVPCTVSGGFILYSTYGHVQSRTSQYFYFYSGEDSAIGKFLCVMELGCFKTEAIGSDPEMGWECWYQGEKVTKKQYLARLEECWDILEQYYGVTYGEENTLHFLDELRKAPDTSAELLNDLLDTLKTDDPQAYISRTPYGEADSTVLYPAWGFGNDSNLADDPAENYTFEPLDGIEVQKTTRFTMYSVPEGEWTIHSWYQSNYIELIYGAESYFFRAAYKYNSEQYFGSALKELFDHAEYAAVPYQAVIPDEGQGFLAAAQTFADSWFSRQLQVSSGSRFAFSSVTCTVWDAGNRETLLGNGRIGENTCTYYVRVIFVPENPHSMMYHDAGNTELYTGNDPAVPKNAYESTLCGYITLEEDGWHGEIGGTGW